MSGRARYRPIWLDPCIAPKHTQIVKAALLSWGPTSRADSDSTVSAAALTLFLLTGLMEAPVLYQFYQALRCVRECRSTRVN